MKPEKLDYVLNRSRKVCFTSPCLPYLPFSAAINLPSTSFARCDIGLYNQFDFILFHSVPMTFYKNWRAMLLEMFNLGQINGFILCIKFCKTSVGGKSNIMDVINSAALEYKIIDDYIDKKSGFNVIFIDIVRKYDKIEDLRAKLKTVKRGEVSFIERLINVIYHKFFCKK